VVGIGNEMSGDDAAGLMLINKLNASHEILTLDVGTVPESFIGKMVEAEAEMILLVDAVDFNTDPGSVGLFEIGQISDFWCTTHRVPLRLLMEFLERETGSEVLLLGIQPKSMGFNVAPSAEVETSVAALAELMNKHFFSVIEELRVGG
jgi:hydrogenase 3 maturation protease